MLSKKLQYSQQVCTENIGCYRKRPAPECAPNFSVILAAQHLGLVCVGDKEKERTDEGYATVGERRVGPNG